MQMVVDKGGVVEYRMLLIRVGNLRHAVAKNDGLKPQMQ